MSKHIYLIGFMGSGKSYWGMRLALLLNLPFLDLDYLIETKEGMSVGSYFESQGEVIFREIERFHLRNIPDAPGSVISVGGGTPCFFNNLDWMNAHGTTIYLRADPEILIKRLANEIEKRPLLKGLNQDQLKERVFYTLVWRDPIYQRAKHIVEVSTSESDMEKALLDIIYKVK